MNWLTGLRVTTAKERTKAAKDTAAAQSLATLESGITIRLLSNAARGEQYAIDELARIDTAIKALGVRKE